MLQNTKSEMYLKKILDTTSSVKHHILVDNFFMLEGEIQYAEVFPLLFLRVY